MRRLKLLLILFACNGSCVAVWAQAAFDDADAQLQVRQAATAASEAALKVEALRKQLEAERKRVVATDGERDLNRATIKALEQELQSADAKQREQEAALKAAQDARTRGLAAETERRRLEEERHRQAVQPPPAPRPTAPVPTAPVPAPPSQAAVDRQYDDSKAAYDRGDYATALRLWRPLAEQGQARAQHSLGFMYDSGQGVLQDYATALFWYRKAADQGYARAQYNLGSMYHYGRGVPQDNVRAHMWLNLAASRFDDSEKDRREQAIKSRDTVAAMMTPAPIAEAQRLAREWKPVTSLGKVPDF